jgi:hypothetical protein
MLLNAAINGRRGLSVSVCLAGLRINGTHSMDVATANSVLVVTFAKERLNATAWSSGETQCAS